MRNRFTKELLTFLTEAKVVGIRSGAVHRYTSVWLVTVEGRVFVRTWNDSPNGWFRAFRSEPNGFLVLDGREIAVTARLLRSERLRKAVTRAYAEKYSTKGSQKWVAGFAEPSREINTLELRPL